ncbi:hypothetical protein [Desulfuromonas sp. CSMB_57]|uniref:hypothetical protein n=1 Tax=Desulfuromonas sp. CSMB_57 TaxID=2807629 RepID=UPI001CD7C00D|nr:hypothetical protein [Desulfuromonas sp. CSMB_57]
MDMTLWPRGMTTKNTGERITLTIIFKIMVIIMVLMVVSGCGTTWHVEPKVAEIDSGGFCVVGHVEYEGNDNYLPKTIKRGREGESLPTIKYEYKIGYGKDNFPEIFPLLNPLSLVGFPVGSDSIVIFGELVIQKHDFLRQYRSTCLINNRRSLFYQGKTLSELRKNGLLMIKKNIESQMVNDREFLSNLIR